MIVETNNSNEQLEIIDMHSTQNMTINNYFFC